MSTTTATNGLSSDNILLFGWGLGGFDLRQLSEFIKGS